MSIKNLSFLKDKESLHHAYLIVGDIPKNLAGIRGALNGLLGSSVGSSPDFFSRVTEVFSVDHSRELVERQKTKSLSGGRRFFVIAARNFTTEAQNGLLKILEDPIPGHHFFILTEKSEVLLPTLRSRLAEVSGEGVVYDSLDSFSREFIEGSITARMLLIEKFLKDSPKDKDGGEKLARHKSLDLLNQMEKVFSEKLHGGQGVACADFLTKLIKMKGYLNDSASSPRLILEYIAFICPQF